MTSEIRTNTLKNRVGLGTVSYTNTGIVVSGIVTANSFSGTGDLDVDGHTNLDNVNIAGFTTFAQSINVLGSMTGQSVVLNAGSPTIFLNDTDTNSDFSIQCNGGLLKFMDTTNSYALRLSINSSGNVAIAKDLDVDGHTNLDNVSIAGVTTISYSGTAQYGLDVHNPTSGGSGIRVRAGDSDSQYALLVENGAGTNLFEVLAGGGGARLRSGDLTILDKITHYGESNTHIRFPANDTISFETSGDERLRLDSTGHLSIKGTNHQARWYRDAGDRYGALFYDGGQFTLQNPTNDNFQITKSDGTVLYKFMNSGKMGIGIASPDSMLHIHTDSAGTVTADADADELVLESAGNTGMSILSPGSGESSIYFGNPGTNGQKDGWIKYYHETHSTTADRRSLVFRTSGGERLRITGSGDVTTTGAGTFNRQNAGFTARAGDAVSITRANGTPLEINRTGSDGQMIGLLDDNSYEAAIGLDGGKLVFGLPNVSTPRLTIKSDGKVGINATPSQMFEVHTDFGLDDNTYQVRTSYRSGNNASGYTASGLHITSSADNNNGEKHTAFLGFSNRDPSLNGNHGSNAFIAMSTPDSQGTYGTAQLDFYIRGGAPYAFPNDPQAASSYWMESLFRIESNGRVKVPGELRVDRIIPAGGLPSSTFGGVVQIRWSANVDNANYSSTSDVTMQTVNFTPLRSDSRVLIHVVYPSIRSYTTGNTRNRLNQHIKRDGTEIYNLGEMPQWRGANFAGSGVEINHNVAFTHIDYPNTTNQVTYTATWQSVDGHVWNTASAQMVMIVAEISG